MLIGSDSVNFGLSVRLLEPVLNRDASNYVIDHYDNIIGYIIKSGIKEEKAHDLLHDVYISIVESENNNKGFDMEYCGRDNEEESGLMEVSQFVYGRVGLYAKNSKYRTDITEAGIGTSYGTEVYYVDDIDIHGNVILNSDGTPRKIRKVKTKKQNVSIVTSAASFNGGDGTETNDGFQMAYAMAEVADSTDDVTELLSLREQIDYCIDLCDMHGVPVLNLFKNIDLLASMLGESSKRTKAHERIFNKMHEIAVYHSEFAESFASVLNFSSKNRYIFDAVISSY